jgi:gamma-glutamylputrescine oxidase
VAFNDAYGMASSYYVATARPFAGRPRLTGDHSADLCVIGGGCTGLAASLFAARRGHHVILLEGGRIGWGASGRNGGQIIPGLRKGPAELRRRYGLAQAKALFELAISARDLVCDLIATQVIDCSLSLTGHLHATSRRSDLEDLKREAEIAARDFAYSSLRVLESRDIEAELDSAAYLGGLLDDKGGHFHPLNYTLGLAQAAESLGVVLHEGSAVTALSQNGKIRIQTGAGIVTASHAIIACDALLGKLDGALAGRIMPIASHVIATAPLSPQDIPIFRDRAISDSRFNVNYFRMTSDRRLLFGGGERYLPGEPRDIAALVRQPLQTIFPRLKDVAIDHAWGGLVSVTTSRLPDIGRRGGIFYAQGYSGQGAILSTLAGKLMADAMSGTTAQFDLLSAAAPKAFPGGANLRTPLHVLGMLWYALRDRIGV